MSAFQTSKITEPTSPRSREFLKGLRSLDQARRFQGPPQMFWQLLLEAMAGLSGARLAALFHQPAGATSWKRRALWQVEGATHAPDSAVLKEMETLAGS